MPWTRRVLFGPFAALVFLVGIASLPVIVPGYDPVRQTVSEIGEVGSPARVPFAVMLLLVSGCILVFASGVRDVARQAGRSRWPAWLIACMAVSSAGIAIFAFPHPLHNVFGLSELVAYQAPLVMALSWRKDPRAATLVAFSWAMAAVVWIMILANLSTLDRGGAVFTTIRPVYGLIQRGLFVSWFAWCAGVGLILLAPAWRAPARA